MKGLIQQSFQPCVKAPQSGHRDPCGSSQALEWVGEHVQGRIEFQRGEWKICGLVWGP
jgi:hypothetical protein